MTRRARRAGDPAGRIDLAHQRYEGPEQLSGLLHSAGSPYGAEEVVERFQRAQAAGEERSVAIPPLFPREPRFEEPEAARRLYGNLFALWEQLATGAPLAAGIVPRAEESPRPAPPLPARGAATGSVLPASLVEAVWKHLDALGERERQRLRDRFEGAQPDLLAWLEARSLDDAAALAAADLLFEIWAMFDVAFGDRLTAVQFRQLREAQEEPLALETTQPALAAYVAEALDLVAEEDTSFGPVTRAQVERALATVAMALEDALEPEDDA